MDHKELAGKLAGPLGYITYPRVMVIRGQALVTITLLHFTLVHCRISCKTLLYCMYFALTTCIDLWTYLHFNRRKMTFSEMFYFEKKTKT